MVEHFKNELRNYNYYKTLIEVVKEKLAITWYDLENVKAIQYDKQPSSHSRIAILDKEYNLRKRIEILEEQKRRLEYQIKYIDDVICSVDADMKEALIDIYVLKKGIRKVAEKRYISHTGLLKQINKELSKALKIDVK